MAYRSSAYRPGSSTSTPTFPVPAGAAAGDIAVVCMFTQANGAITPPAGFTIKYDSGIVLSWRTVVFWKRLTGADTGTYDFTLSASGYTEGPVGLFSGRVTTGDPWTATSSAGTESATSLAAPSVTAAADDDLVGQAASFNGGNWTPPSGMIERQDTGAQCILATADAVTAGATGDKTFTYAGGASSMKAFLGALAVDGGGGSPPGEGTGTGTTTWAGSATGERDPEASGTGSTVWTGAATGERTPVATGSGATAWTGAATGAAPVVDGASGSGSGSTVWTGTATGKRTPLGSGTGTTAWVGSGVGDAPLVDVSSGTGTGTTTWTGSGVGQRTPKADGSGVTAWTGTGSGITSRSGSGAGVTTWTGTAFGTTADIVAPPERTATVPASPRVSTVSAAARTAIVPSREAP